MSVDPVLFRVVQTPDERLAAFAVRAIVFIGEQRCPFAEEFDAHDATAVHVLGCATGEPVAAARLREVEGRTKLERLAILAAWRGRGHGHALVEFLLDTARARGHRRFVLHAQSHLDRFYAAHGFAPHGAPFVEAGIEHVRMLRDDA